MENTQTAPPEKTAANPYIDDQISKFNDELIIAGYSQRTMIMYELYVRDFLGFANKKVEEIGRQDVVSFIAAKKQKDNLANSSLALIHAALHYFFHEFHKHKILEDIKIPKKAKKITAVLTPLEIKQLINATKFGRNRCIIEFLYSTGTRVSEATKIKLVDLDLKERIARVKGGKGNKDRIIILSNTWIKDFKKYLKRRKIQSDFVFSKKNGKPITPNTIQRIIKKACAKAEITKYVTPHKLRHAFATHLLNSGENIRYIQELLGHSSLSTTQIYLNVTTDDLKKVRSPLDRLNKGMTL
ncbi:MAG: tyrosine-type recombinase/integrase [archaeon]|nr:tyrosine-type recombinase/integrase [archaeon]